MNVPLRVLCIDHEGGRGGASRSLLSSISHIDRAAVSLEVWCRRSSSLERSYAALGVPCRIITDIPTFRAQRSLRATLIDLVRASSRMWLSSRGLTALANEIDERFDVVHFNFESLHLFARWLRTRVSARLVTHMRNWPYDRPWVRWQCRSMPRTYDHFVFITENECRMYTELASPITAKSVIYNIAPVPSDNTRPHDVIPMDSRFRIASLANYSYAKGIDRLVDVAGELAKSGRRDVLFIVAGDVQLHAYDPGDLGRLGRKGCSLKQYAQQRGVADMFCFLGHVSEPESVFVSCDAVARLSRRGETWGRDFIEALAVGKPVIGIGRWDRFVEHGVTGILHHEFDATAIAREIIVLADNRDQCYSLGKAGQERIMKLCDGPERAADLLHVWQAVAEQPSRSDSRDVSVARATG